MAMTYGSPWGTGITTDYLESLGKQMFIKETILNGMFPCQSDFTKLLRNKKQDWNFHEFYEYRMLLANSNTGGSINSQLFNPSGSLRKPGTIDIGVFRATYGTVSDGFDIDMIENMETSDAKRAFLTRYASQLHSMRMNVASIFKNVAINGRFGVVHRIQQRDLTSIPAGGIPTPGVPFTLAAPSNVYASGFAAGRLLMKTKGSSSADLAPWGPADCAEMYLILDNQPRRLTLVLLPHSSGTNVGTEWNPGQFLQLTDNRTTVGAGFVDYEQPSGGNQYGRSVGQGAYTSGATAGTGFMEGLQDLLPWHHDPTVIGSLNRIGLDRPFRGQQNRLIYQTQLAGGFYAQQLDAAGNPTESIIDAVLNGVRLATLAVPYEELGVWMNHDTRLAIAAQEADDVKIFRQINVSQPIVFQRGVTATTYTIGSKEIPDVISDDNFPTDIVIVGPKLDMSYCTLDNAFMKIDDFVQNTFSKEAPPKPENLQVPNDLVTSLNIGKRFVLGSPVMGDGKTAEGLFVHPGNRIPVAYHEMGSIFTENPHAYVVVKLARQIVNPAEAAYWGAPAGP